MQPDAGRQAVEQELERVLDSPAFRRNERLSRFLRFVVEHQLDGRESELKESTLGVEVFDRKPGFDPRVDGIVRTEAIRLRARLAQHYASEGAGASLVIELPKGGYRPVFRRRPLEPVDGGTLPRPAWRRRAAWAATLLVAAAGTLWAVRGPRPASPIAVGVLPFENVGRDPDRDYIADGITDQVIGSLAMVEGLTVPSRTSSFAFRQATPGVARAGSRLGVDYLVEGAVLQAGDRMTVHVALVRVRDERRVWSARFDRELAGVSAVHDDVAKGVVDTLRLKPGPGRRHYEENLEAFSLYLRARQIMASFPTQGRPTAELAIDFYRQAIAKDDRNALAYAGLADTYLAVERNLGAFPWLGQDLLARAKAAAASAMELDSMLSESHAARGAIYAREYGWNEAERSLRDAIRLNPNNALARLELGFRVLLVTGRVEEGLVEVRRAVRLDPLSPHVTTEYGRALFWAGRYDASIDTLREAIALEPTRARGYGALARSLAARDRLGDAMIVFEEAFRRGTIQPGMANADLVCVAARAGRRDLIAAMAQRQLANPVGFIAARAHACLGDDSQALALLERAAAAREPNLAEILQAPDLGSIGDNPRIAVLRQQLNLPSRSW